MSIEGASTSGRTQSAECGGANGVNEVDRVAYPGATTPPANDDVRVAQARVDLYRWVDGHGHL